MSRRNLLMKPILRYPCGDSDSSMDLDPVEEEWSCVNDIVATNGQILEYVGHGRTILDVGFAQARDPLTPTSHYFEIEIIDPGENCYIAIGLTCKDYPKNRHPGWDEGSVAYHADDGKIFAGSEVGENFGPKCHKGDVLGCGISFSSYHVDSHGEDGNSSDDTLSLSDNECPNTFIKLNNSFRNNGRSGNVEVFFTRNGSVIGTRRVRMPVGGFFPSVGMLSTNEKVRFDLKPLTG